MEYSLVPRGPRLQRLDARRAQLEHVLGDDHGAAPTRRREGVRLALGLLPRVQVDDLVAVDLMRTATSRGSAAVVQLSGLVTLFFLTQQSLIGGSVRRSTSVILNAR